MPISSVSFDRSGILKNDNANGGKPNFFYSAERGQLNSPGQESLPVCGQGLFCIVICYLQFCRVVKQLKGNEQLEQMTQRMCWIQIMHSFPPKHNFSLQYAVIICFVFVSSFPRNRGWVQVIVTHLGPRTSYVTWKRLTNYRWNEKCVSYRN